MGGSGRAPTVRRDERRRAGKRCRSPREGDAEPAWSAGPPAEKGRGGGGIEEEEGIENFGD